MATKYTDEQKEQALTMIKAGGQTLQMISEKTGVEAQTLSNWRKAAGLANGKAPASPATNGEGAETPKRSKASDAARMQDLEFTLRLHTLEIKYLRRIARSQNGTEKLNLELQYLRERLKLWGDPLVKDLLAEADDDEEEEEGAEG
jgi:transposase-like protein